MVIIPNSNLTVIEINFKGSFNDPILLKEGFSNYSLIHKIYSITYLIYFIMTGGITLYKPYNLSLKEFVEIGMNNDNAKRFQSMEKLITKFNSIPEY